MSAKSRDRVQARKRYEKYQARQVKLRERRIRNRAIGVSVTVIIALVLVVWATRPKHEPPPQASETAAVDTSPAAEVTPQPGDVGESSAAAEQPASAGERHTGADGEPLAKPDPAAAEDREWTGTITLNGQPVTISLDGTAAPQAVANFTYLAQQGYFDNTTCHRLTTSGIFVLQCGDPEATGMGGPGYNWGPIENAPADDVYKTGTLAMARVGGDGESMGSQFFIVYEDSTIPSDGAGGYTVFGSVTDGLDVVNQIADAGVDGGAGDGAPAAGATIEKVEVQ